MSTSQEYTISRKVSDTEEEIIQIPYDALADKPDLSVYQTKNDASLKTNDKTVVGAINEVVTGVAETLETFGMSLAPQENGKLNKKVYVFPDGYLSQGTSYDASKDLYLSIGDGLTLETIDEANNIWNIKSGSAITSVDGLGGGAISGDVSTSGNLTVGCNLTINGTTTTVDSTTLQVKDKLIEVAHGNTAALTTPAGLVAPQYDGTNSGALVFDSTGTAYVGDVKLDSTGNIDVAKSELQPLATRTGLVGGNLVQYDSSALTLKDSGKKIGDLALKTDLSGKANLSGSNTFSGNQVITGYLDIRGTAAEKHLKTRGIGGSDGNGNSSDLYLQYSSSYKTYFGKEGQSSLNSDGSISIYGNTVATVDQIPPAANDGILTIQKNGETVGTFTANQKDGTTANITVPTKASDVNALSLDGGTINKSKTIKMDASANSDGANLKWGTVNSKNPYIGYASDQTDGTFVIGSLLGTNYASGLAIGGGSGNLLWKGTKVATTSDIPNIVQSTGTSTSSVMSQNATTNAISGKLDKTTYEVNKTINFGRDGALYIGKFKVYDTNVTCEVTSTTSVTYSGKLVIATQNYVIKETTVYGDAANTVAPNIYIKPSSESDPYIEVYFKPESWSKNIIHIYGSEIKAEPTDVCTSIPAVPSTATIKPKNALPIYSLSGTTLTITL